MLILCWINRVSPIASSHSRSQRQKSTHGNSVSLRTPTRNRQASADRGRRGRYLDRPLAACAPERPCATLRLRSATSLRDLGGNQVPQQPDARVSVNRQALSWNRDAHRPRPAPAFFLTPGPPPTDPLSRASGRPLTATIDRELVVQPKTGTPASGQFQGLSRPQEKKENIVGTIAGQCQ